MGKTFAGCLLAFALVGATMAQRPGRRQRPRGGRDGQGYAAPPADTGYAAPSDDQPAYQDQDVYQGAASDAISSDDNLAMLEKSVPGVPGEDYPIYSEVPETGFGCEGQVDGGYYADPEAECQVFHICASTVSSVPTELSSTRTISSATGGSTLTALRLRVSTLSMTRLLPKEKLTPVLPPTLSAHTLLLTMVPSEAMMLPLTWLRMLKLLTVRPPETQEPDVDLSSPSARGARVTREEGDRDREDLGVKRRIK